MTVNCPFLLTRLMRGAAYKPIVYRDSTLFLLTRLMRGAAVYSGGFRTFRSRFLLTRLMRGAACSLFASFCSNVFLLTRLMRGAAPRSGYKPPKAEISTHAPHARRGDITVPTDTFL